MAAVILTAIIPATSTRAQSWRIEGELPSARTGMAVAALPEQIYLIGGRTRSDRASTAVLRYDPASHRWSDDVGQLHKPRVNPAVATLGGKIFIMGGRNGEGEVLSSVEVFDPRQNVWKEFPELEQEREGATAVVLREQIYVIGGSDQDERALETVERYNPVEERWEEVGEWKLDSPRVSPGVAAVDATIYVFGGFNVFGPVGSLQSYDTDLVSAQSTEMPVALGGLAAIPVGKGVYVIGGRSRDRVLNAVSLFRTTDRGWTDVSPMQVARFGFGAVRFKDVIYAFGGIGSEGNPLASFEAFGPLGTAADTPADVTEFRLDSPFPNPFWTETRFTFSLPTAVADPARIRIYDIAGRLVRTMEEAAAAPGEHVVAWDGKRQDGRSASAGVYVARLTQGKFSATTKLVLVR